MCELRSRAGRGCDTLRGAVAFEGIDFIYLVQTTRWYGSRAPRGVGAPSQMGGVVLFDGNTREITGV
eukprot:6102292-Prymnesium_polylepis.2